MVSGGESWRGAGFRISPSLAFLPSAVRLVAVKSDTQAQCDSALVERLAQRGFRFTPQREHVYNVLLEKRDHPTAEQVFLRAKASMPEISMATVYNCLDALVECLLVREVTLDRGAARFCPNMREHGHFHCEECGGTFDVALSDEAKASIQLPRGFVPAAYDLSVRGLCPACAARKRA